MPAPKYLRVRNWDQYQHYKSGRQSEGPMKWVKLHASMLHDWELTDLSVEAQLLADRLLLVAGLTDNCIASDPKYIASATKVPLKCVPRAIAELRSIGFVEPFSAKTKSRQSLSQSRQEESRQDETRLETPLTPLVENSVENPVDLKLLTNGLLREIA